MQTVYRSENPFYFFYSENHDSFPKSFEEGIVAEKISGERLL